jgi:transcriptional regulator with XRE-family HTH domain
MTNATIDLRADRLNRGLSQQRAADAIGVTRRQLFKAEHGSQPRNPADALKIAEFYGYQVTDIWPIGEVAA